MGADAIVVFIIGISGYLDGEFDVSGGLRDGQNLVLGRIRRSDLGSKCEPLHVVATNRAHGPSIGQPSQWSDQKADALSVVMVLKLQVIQWYSGAVVDMFCLKKTTVILDARFQLCLRDGLRPLLRTHRAVVGHDK